MVQVFISSLLDNMMEEIGPTSTEYISFHQASQAQQKKYVVLAYTYISTGPGFLPLKVYMIL